MNKKEQKKRRMKSMRKQPEIECKSKKIRSRAGSSLFDPQFGQTVQKLAEELRPFLNEQDRETVDRCVDLYKRNEFVIMVAGEISVGKSSFLNALMGQSVLLTDTTETTAAITYLRSAEGCPDVKPDHVRINYKNGKSEWFSIYDTAKLRRATTSLNGNMKAIGTVKSAEVYCSKETLAIPPGFTIIDTPGLNGSDSHAELTHREMGLCHAALYLLDATKFGTLSNREEFQKLYRYAPEVLFVVNKWDLVRNSAGADLETMKHETYFPKLGNWASDGVVTDENIFVISGAEAYEAKMRYFDALKQQDRLPKSRQQKIDDRAFLPFRDNEFFALEGKLQQVLMSGEKSKMIRRRPLQTLLQLAKDAQDAYAEREASYLSDDAELERKIAAEAVRIRRERDEAAACFDEIRNFASRLADFESKEYQRALVAGEKAISDLLCKFINACDLHSLGTSAGQRAISGHLQKLVERNFRKPVTERFSHFVAFLRQQLEMDEQIQASDGVVISHGADLSEEISDLQREQRKLEQLVSELGPERESILTRKSQLQGKTRKLSRELTEFENSCEVYQTLVAEREVLRRKRASIGSRPAKTTRTEYRTVTRYREGGILRKIGSFFGLCDDYEEVEEEVPVRVSDDSKGKAWDKKFAELDRKVKAAERQAESARPDEHRRNRLNEQLRDARAQIAKCDEELSRLEERAREQEAEYRRFGETSLRQRVQANWQKELSRIRAAFEQTVRGFRDEVTHFLDAFMQTRTERIERSIAEMGDRERDLAERRRRSSDAFAEIKRGRVTLTRIVTDLEKQLKLED